jgi:hypothetical protein
MDTCRRLVSAAQEATTSAKGSVLAPNSSPQEARQRHERRAAENVQRALLTEIAPLLPGFVAACDMGQMLYLTPLLVTTLCDYPEELSIQLQLVEAMHRIIHLPLSCWSDALTADDAQEQAQEVSMVHGCMAEHSEHSEQGAMYTPIYTPQKYAPAGRAGAAGMNAGTGYEGGDSPGERRRQPGLLATSRDGTRKYASCCTPLRTQRRYGYFRPHIMEAEETAAVLAAGDWRLCSGAALDAAAGVRAFEKVCEVIVLGLLHLVELQNNEIALFRALVVCSSSPPRGLCELAAIGEDTTLAGQA